MSEPCQNQVIYLKGDDREIGRQHGEILKGVIHEGMIRFYSTLWKELLELSPREVWKKPLFGAAKFLIDPIMVKRLVKELPKEAHDRILGLSEGAGLPLPFLYTTVILPDLFPLLQAFLGKLRPHLYLDVKMPIMGCTSLLARSSSAGSEFYYGRNLDFPGVGYWDQFPVIQVVERKNSLKHIGFATAGVPISGITGINEAQISVSLHQHYALATSFTGTLPFFTGERILSEAKNLEEARAILDEAKVASSWAFVVCDGKTSEGFIYEAQPRARGINKWTKGTYVLAHSNFFQSGECKKSEYSTTARMSWDNYWRKTRLEQIAKEHSGNPNPEQMVAAISDHYDGYWGEEKIANRTVSQTYNIQSVVLELKNGKAWIAEGNSPVHLRNFAEFDLNRLFSGQDGRTGKAYSGFRFKDPKMKESKERYISSFKAAFDRDWTRSLTELDLSIAAAPSAEALLIRGIISLKVGDYKTAEDFLGRARSLIEQKKTDKKLTRFPPEYFETRVFQARCYDLMGRREAALKEYRSLAKMSDLEDENIRRIAESEKKYTAARLDTVVMPFSSYIPFE